MASNKPLLCIYHGNCIDGFGSAWVVRKHAAEAGIPVDFHAGIYQNPPPDVTGRKVIMVDFSYKRDVLIKMADSADVIQIIDHHKSAEADLKDIEKEANNINAIFDMERSGAGLTWDTLNPSNTYPERPRPELINYIEDRDLWRFKLPLSREVNAAIFSYPYDFEIWDKLMAPGSLAGLRVEGAAIDRKHLKDIRELIPVTKQNMRIGSRIVPVVNLPYTMGSDACHIMCEDAKGAIPFAAYYYDTPDGRVFGMRSIEGGADVSEIAKLYGGGGHKHAAGFRVSYYDAAQFLPM